MKKTGKGLAVDIGTSTLKLAVYSILKNHFSLLKAKLYEFPGNNNEEFVKASVQEFLKGDVDIKKVRVALSSPCVEIERVDIPVMPVDEILEAVKWKIRDKISFKIEDAVINYSKAGEFTADDGSKRLIIMAAAVSRKEIDKILLIFKDLNLTVDFIDAIPFGFTRILSLTHGKTVSVIEMGANHAYVSIYESNKLMFIRNIPVSSNQITSSLCGALMIDKGRVELSSRDAEDIKRRFGVPVKDGEMLDGKIPAVNVIAMMRPVLEQLASEIRRTFNYYVSEFKGAMPDMIYLAGGGAGLKNLDRYLNGELGMDVQYLDLPDIMQGDIQSSFPFLGLAGTVLPHAGMRVNLLPPEFISEKREAIKKIGVRIAGFTLFSIFTLLYLYVNVGIYSYKRGLEGAVAHRGSLQTVIDYYNKLSQFDEAVKIIKKGEVQGEAVFKELSNIVPVNIILDELILDFNDRKVEFHGVIYPESPVVGDELTRFMEMIEDSVFFKEANLVLLEKREEGESRTNFEIICTIE